MAAAEVILRLVDQVSGPAQRLKASLGSVGEAARRATAGDSFRKMVTDLRATADQAQRLKARLDGVEASARRIGAGIRQIGSGLKTGAMTAVAYEATKYGAALGFLKTQLLGTQIEFENYRAELETTLRSKDKAQKAMDFASDFAFTTPFELPDVVKAMKFLVARNLANVDNMDKLRRVMTATGDAASIMGKNFPYAVDAISDLFAGHSTTFESLTGLNAIKKGNSWLIQYVNREGKLIKKAIDVSKREAGLYQIVQTLEDLYKGGMLRKSQTTEGMISNYMDTWVRFKKMILDAGLGNEINRQLQSGLDWLGDVMSPRRVKTLDNYWETLPSKASEWAAQISDMLQSRMREAIDLVRQLYEQIKRIADVADSFANSKLGQAIGGWRGIITGVLAAPFVKPIFDVAKGLWDVAAGFAAISIQGLLAYKTLKVVRDLAAVTGAAATPAAAGTVGVMAAATTGAPLAGAVAGSLRAAVSVVGKGAIAGIAAYLLEQFDQKGNLWGLTGGIDEWVKKRFGFDPSNIPIPAVPKMPGMFEPLQPVDTSKLPALRAKLARINANIADIESGKKTTAIPIETLKAARDAVKKQVDDIEAELKRIQGMTVTPNIDTSSMDIAIAKAEQFLSYLRQIGSGTAGIAAPAAPAGGGTNGGSSRGGPVNVTVNVTGGGSGDAATARKVASAVRETLNRTYGDGAYRPTMVG